jgi:hypothetical protein
VNTEILRAPTSVCQCRPASAGAPSLQSPLLRLPTSAQSPRLYNRTTQNVAYDTPLMEEAIKGLLDRVRTPSRGGTATTTGAKLDSQARQSLASPTSPYRSCYGDLEWAQKVGRKSVAEENLIAQVNNRGGGGGGGDDLKEMKKDPLQIALTRVPQKTNRHLSARAVMTRTPGSSPSQIGNTTLRRNEMILVKNLPTVQLGTVPFVPRHLLQLATSNVRAQTRSPLSLIDVGVSAGRKGATENYDVISVGGKPTPAGGRD